MLSADVVPRLASPGQEEGGIVGSGLPVYGDLWFRCLDHVMDEGESGAPMIHTLKWMSRATSFP